MTTKDTEKRWSHCGIILLTLLLSCVLIKTRSSSVSTALEEAEIPPPPNTPSCPVILHTQKNTNMHQAKYISYLRNV